VLDVRRLRILQEVARRGSLSAAAQALSYTPSAVSQQIAALEREAGAVLVERRARGVVLTEAGRTLAEHADVVLRELERAQAALDELADLRRGRLRIASFATAGATLVPRAVDAFRRRHPEIELSVTAASPAAGVEQLRAGRLDLAMVVDHAEDASEGVTVTHLLDDPFRLALPRNHPLAARPDLRLEDLAGETWVNVPQSVGGGTTLLLACAAAGFSPRIAFESDDYLAIRELVAAGAGVALIPELALALPGDAVVLRDLGPDGPRRVIGAATRRPPYRSPAADAMLEVLAALRAPQTVAATPPSR